MAVVDLTTNDDLVDVVKKSNTNFRLLNTAISTLQSKTTVAISTEASRTDEAIEEALADYEFIPNGFIDALAYMYTG